jgi:hypothetical protein
MTAPPPETAADYSKGPPASPSPEPVLRWALRALAAAAFAGPLLLIAADLTTLIEVTVDGRRLDSIAGRDHHSWAMLILGAAALPMAYGAAAVGSRPAMGALAAIGAIAAAIALIGDLPDVNSTGAVGTALRDAQASPQIGFYLETLGAALSLIAGGGALILTAPTSRREPPSD